MLLVTNGRLTNCVAIEGSLIKEVGDTDVLSSKYPGAEIIDAKGGMILPGNINAHNHIYSAFARGLALPDFAPQSFGEILEGLWWKLDRKLRVEDVKWSAYAILLDCIKNGTTTVFDHHASYGEVRGSLFAIADVAKELGVRVNLCYEVSDRDGEAKMHEAVTENEEFIRYAAKDTTDMVAGMMGLHASFTLSDKTIEHCRKRTPEGVGFHIHVAEGPEDVDDCQKKYGKRVVERLYDMEVLGKNTIAGHCVHIDENEMDLLKESGTMVVHNPQSNMGNKVGIPACAEMIGHGILMGLGTDGYTQDMFESQKVASLLHGPAWRHENAAIAANSFSTKLGVLEAGAAADIIICDYDPPTLIYESNLAGHMHFGINGLSVVTTIINGEVKMKDRKFVGIDSRAIMAKCREQAKALWGNL